MSFNCEAGVLASWIMSKVHFFGNRVAVDDGAFVVLQRFVLHLFANKLVLLVLHCISITAGLI